MPTSEIGHQDIRAEVQLWFIEQDPSAWAILAALEWGTELFSKRRGGECMSRGGGRAHVKITANDLADYVLGER